MKVGHFVVHVGPLSLHELYGLVVFPEVLLYTKKYIVKGMRSALLGRILLRHMRYCQVTSGISNPVLNIEREGEDTDFAPGIMKSECCLQLYRLILHRGRSWTFVPRINKTSNWFWDQESKTARGFKLKISR